MPIVTRRGAGGAPEHGAEGAHALIAEVQRHLRDRRAAAQSTHCFEHPCLLAPCTKAETGFAMEPTRQCAAAGVHAFRPCGERALIAGRLEQCLAEAAQSSVA